MRGIKTGLLLIVASLSLAGTLMPKVHAVDGIDLTTSPLPINITAVPGTKITTDVRVRNDSTNTQKIKVSLMKFSAYGETGKPALKDREPGDDYFDWVSFAPASFDAPPGQWVTTKMSINVPTSAGFGYYYAVVFTPGNDKPTGKGNVLIGSSAVLVLLEIQNPGAKKEVQVTSYSASRHIYEFLPVRFDIKIHNSGNVHVVPHGMIFIKRGSKEIAQLQLNSQQGNVLPGTNRVYEVSWTEGFPVYVDKQQGGKTATDKNGRPEKQLSWDFSKISRLRIGRYSAHLTAVYDNGKQDVPIDATVNFWVIPWRILAVSLFILALLGFGLWAAVVKPVTRRVRKDKTSAKTKK